MTWSKRWAASAVLVLVSAFALGACSDSDDSDSAETEMREGTAIKVSGFDFGESQILAEIYP